MSLPRTFVSAFHDAAAVARMPYNKFGSVGDIALSKVSIGGSAAGAVFGGVDDERSIGVLVAAVRAGVNM
ncbi:MAG: hypothetical protein P4L40_03380, partial [Terracidiphilus sp.]|nr:hypothetical protein [Terracidiphilus sp.]